MNQRKTFSTASMVRNALKAQKRPMRIFEIRNLVGLEGDDGYAKVNRALHDLLKAGEVERPSPGNYLWVGAVPESAYCKKQKRIQRIIWIRSKKGEPFTVRKVSELAECSLDLSRAYITFLRKKEFLVTAGKARTSGRGRAPMYLAAADKLNEEWPVMRQHGKTALIDECVEKLQTLASNFFRMEDVSRETLLNLKTTADELVKQVRKCEEIALGLGKNG